MADGFEIDQNNFGICYFCFFYTRKRERERVQNKAERYKWTKEWG